MWRRVGEFLPVGAGKALQYSCAFRCEPNSGVSAVAGPSRANRQAAIFQPVDQANGTMVSNEQMRRQGRDVRPLVRFQPADGQHHLMLLRFQTFGARGLLARVQKAADLEAKVGESAILVERQSAWSPKYIVSRYDADSQVSQSRQCHFVRKKITN